MKIVILGAGISGLAAAWFLRNSFPDITLIEKSNRVGGVIWTVREKEFLFELGARGFRPSGKGRATLALACELGLKEKLVAADPCAMKRYIYSKGKLRRVNVPFLLSCGLIGGALHDLVTRPTRAEDESIYDFFVRRFNHKFAENVIDPLTKGIFGSDCRSLSVQSCFPQLWRFDQEKGVVRGFLSKKREHPKLAALYTFQEGMEELPKTLAKRLQCPIELGKKITSLKEIDADCLIAAIPSSELAQLAGLQDPLHYSTIGIVNFGWNSRVLKKRGFGFLAPSSERAQILGMSWDSEIFPAHNLIHQTRITVMLEGNKSSDELLTLALASVKKYLNIGEEPRAFHVHNAQIPKYTLYHRKRVEAFKKQLPPHVHFLGNCYEGVGINDCIAQAHSLASLLGKKTAAMLYS